MEGFLQDLRYAVRTLTKRPAFASAAIATLALGIGATTAIFSVVDGVVLRPLPFADPVRLVQVYGTPALRGEAVDDIEIYRQQSTSFDALVGYAVSARYLRGPSEAERVMTVAADPGFFDTLGVPPRAGRTFQASDGANVAVVSESFAREHLGGDQPAVGMTVDLDGAAFTIVGVMPETFQFPYNSASALSSASPETRTDAWTPWVRPAAPRSRTDRVTGRLRAGVSLGEAQAELDVISARIQVERPDVNGARGVRLALLADAVASSVRRPLFILLGAVGIVLALACANVANLLLARATVRRHEMAVRAALGASPQRIIRQLLTESLALALMGGGLGLGAAYWGTRELAQFATATLPRAREVAIDWRIFLFAFAVSVAAAALVGIAPAMIAMRTKSQTALQDSGARSTMGRGSRLLRNNLVVAEIALSFALAAGAALLVRELVRLKTVDTGMDTANVVTFHLGERPAWWGTGWRGAPPEEYVRGFYEIARQVAALPGVRAAGFTQFLPLQNWGWMANIVDLRVRGSATPAPPPIQVELRYVTPGYFEALGMRVRRGRTFTLADNRDAPPVIVINETLARRLLGGEDPVGAVTPRGTVVGVVGDIRQVNLDRSASPEIYYPIAQNYSELVDLGMTLIVRGEGPPDNLIGPVRDVIRRVSPNQAVFNVKTMPQVIAESMADFTLYLWLMTGFAVLALALAAIGTYGVMAYISAARTREFAVRVALGANAGQLTRLVLGEGMRLTIAGMLLGIAAAVAATPLLRAFPITVRPPNIAVLAGVALLVGAAAMAACLLPALHAAGADPIQALREE